MQRKSKFSYLILLFLFVSVFYPLLIMLLRVEWSTFPDLLSSAAFKNAFNNSLLITSIATVISVLLAYVLAYTLNRT